MLDKDELKCCFTLPNTHSRGVTPCVEKSLEEGVRED
jgi:hypothetical protein